MSLSTTTEWAAPARIGPNAVTQLLTALRGQGHAALAGPLFGRAGAADWFAAPPHEMIDAARVARIHQSVRRELPPGEALAVLQDAGRLTAEYLLAHRIPRPAQIVLKALPPLLAAKTLVPAISRHAWTFAGAGTFTAHAGRPTVFAITGNPLCAGETASAPVCTWHAAVFQRLFAELVARSARVTEESCEACGGECCRFVVAWG